ncbi:Smr/MutS family protein [Polyangium sp. 15x6]|uniref:Smr/MutS family protein n=1 Tax=Polyangium sp. 15x6 TaxID=3042687 RepID=UPI00249B5884|nr:Smr/MutS family protein [Polyangium sp. 15x6]MDI3290529.1 Smr/MutS family protein [Polyangium sp. 15x6]
MLRALLDHLARLLSPAKPKEPPSPEEPEDDEPLPDPDAIAVLPIEDAIDLHGFAPRDIPSVVEEYLLEAHARGFPEVRLIHGRGKGVQRRVVQSLLARHPLVESFRDAPATRGGWGATIARLKINRA